MKTQETSGSSFGADAHHPLGVQMLMCSLRVRRKVAETMPMAQHSLPQQVVGSGLLGVHRQEGMVDSHQHTEIFLGCALCCMTDWAFTQMKRVCVLHAPSQE